MDYGWLWSGNSFSQLWLLSLPQGTAGFCIRKSKKGGLCSRVPRGPIKGEGKGNSSVLCSVLIVGSENKEHEVMSVQDGCLTQSGFHTMLPRLQWQPTVLSYIHRRCICVTE